MLRRIPGNLTLEPQKQHTAIRDVRDTGHTGINQKGNFRFSCTLYFSSCPPFPI
ncbi:MAG: hypothetical protein ACOX7E_00110 [Paludibacter sp.]